MGRKYKYGEPTERVRIPVRLMAIVQKFIYDYLEREKEDKDERLDKANN